MYKNKMAEMPKPENPYNYQDLFDSRVAFWEGAQAQCELALKEGWRKVPSALRLAVRLAELIKPNEIGNVRPLAEELCCWLMEEDNAA